MNVETVLLAAGTAVAAALVTAAVLFQRRDRSLRARLIVLFVIGGILLKQVNVEEGRQVAQAEDQAELGAMSVK